MNYSFARFCSSLSYLLFACLGYEVKLPGDHVRSEEESEARLVARALRRELPIASWGFCRRGTEATGSSVEFSPPDRVSVRPMSRELSFKIL